MHLLELILQLLVVHVQLLHRFFVCKLRRDLDRDEESRQVGSLLQLRKPREQVVEDRINRTTVATEQGLAVTLHVRRRELVLAHRQHVEHASSGVVRRLASQVYLVRRVQLCQDIIQRLKELVFRFRIERNQRKPPAERWLIELLDNHAQQLPARRPSRAAHTRHGSTQFSSYLPTQTARRTGLQEQTRRSRPTNRFKPVIYHSRRPRPRR
mmetsp:Transcript_15452/g.36459  ORF Transcript_15452/g.36459 Transcript_15452/m.36459 type:complete len:211 (-) Transcript_15452:21-653(-)